MTISKTGKTTGSLIAFTFFVITLVAAPLQAQSTTLDPATRQLARDVFKQLIEINSTDSIGSTTAVAEAMRKRLLDAGFAPADAIILGPNPRKGNLVVRLHGRSGNTLKPVLIICHTDVVEAKREDWTTDPFVFTEKDGFFYGRGTQDMKDSNAAMVMAFIRMKRENYVPNRDLILALTADEEGGKSNGVDWLLKNHRDLIDAGIRPQPRCRRTHYEKRQAHPPRRRSHRKALRRLPCLRHQSRRTQLSTHKR